MQELSLKFDFEGCKEGFEAKGNFSYLWIIKCIPS